MILHNITGEHTFFAPRDAVQTHYLFITQATNITLVLVPEQGAQIDLHIVHLQHDSVATIHTMQQHEKPHARTRVMVTGVLSGQSRLNYTSMVRVGPQAQFTYAEQQSAAILLDLQASAQATPALEVLTNNVQCKHGSAFAPCDARALEYAASRGIAPQVAQRMLIESFLYARFDNPQARIFLKCLLEQYDFCKL